MSVRNSPPLFIRPAAVAVAAALSCSAWAQEGDRTLAPVTIKAVPSPAEKVQSPATTEGVSREKIAETINVMNTEDAFKYLPDVLVRKRFIGDTDAPMSSRTTGINASARSLVYADGILLSTLIANNNGNGSPRWFMVSPEEIERVDVMYGPFSAAYPGNSYGLVAEMTTRMPDKLEASAKATAAWQDFSQYGTNKTYKSESLGATVGNRVNDFSFWLSANHLDSHSQPVTYGTVTNGTAAGAQPVVSGSYATQNKTGGPIQVLGPGNLTHTIQDTAKLKLAYDFTPTVQGAYTFGFWQNNADIRAQTYLKDASGNPYYGGAGTNNLNINGFRQSADAVAALFSPGRREMEHHMHNVMLRDNSSGTFAWDLALSHYEYDQHKERTGLTGAQGSGAGKVTYGTYPTVLNSGAGRILDMNGTGWTTFDAKGTWRPQGAQGEHTVKFGVHYDYYNLEAPTYNTTNWSSGSAGTLFSDSRGKTEAKALWVQDVWHFAPALSATFGGRYEWWTAYDGSNSVANTAVAGWPVSTIAQPGQDRTAFSPKASLGWEMTPQWLMTGSVGRAVRFPTVGELYSTIQVGAIYQSANPNLKPEDVLSTELSAEYTSAKGKVRVSLFEEHVKDAIISQTATYPGIATPTAYTQNVDQTRQRGIELSFQQQDVLIRGLELTGSYTFVDARITDNSSYKAPAATPWATSEGKRTPYIPIQRATLVASYRPDDRWTYTLAGRFVGNFYSTVDNTDINGHTYQGFEKFLVADARIRYQFAKQWSGAVGVDNINNKNYYLFHPFPQRTVFAELKFDL